jgi:hypothetical protein
MHARILAVAALRLLTGVLVTRAQQPVADTIPTNGKIITVDDRFTMRRRSRGEAIA